MTLKVISDRMLALRQNYGAVLDPAAGKGCFAEVIDGCVGIEIDATIGFSGATIMNFFSYPESNKFETIISDLPYVPYKEIERNTLDLLPKDKFDKTTNLYICFIDKCLRHLKPGGELILVTSRNFTKAVNSAWLNELLFATGTITHFFDLGDRNFFPGSDSTKAIWRFEKEDYRRKTVTLGGEKLFSCSGGQLLFLDASLSQVRFGDIFEVKVGAISGANEIFENEELGNVDFVCSYTAKSGKTRRMICNSLEPAPFLVDHKDKLINRKVAKFSERNWWTWGRMDYISDDPRIYVNERTRNKNPFFTNPCKRYDSTVLAIFPKNKLVDINSVILALNKIDWQASGFVHGGRFIFSKKSLEEFFLPDHFSIFA